MWLSTCSWEAIKVQAFIAARYFSFLSMNSNGHLKSLLLNVSTGFPYSFGPEPPDTDVMCSTDWFKLFEQLRHRYEYIIVDTAPIGMVSDTFTLDRSSDAAIYVCRANYTSLSDLAKSYGFCRMRFSKAASVSSSPG